jgi:hypothetical protein
MPLPRYLFRGFVIAVYSVVLVPAPSAHAHPEPVASPRRPDKAATLPT